PAKGVLIRKLGANGVYSSLPVNGNGGVIAPNPSITCGRAPSPVPATEKIDCSFFTVFIVINNRK
ncbi:hypothetical protein SB775_28250, partial [Peribacillus sp. SIMBA_075]|uniref:hypothetical protein n=1 Tax=Peribacillus sp. SIMBA_075 TaxID=3085813 RepID=UPI00397BD626